MQSHVSDADTIGTAAVFFHLCSPENGRRLAVPFTGFADEAEKDTAFQTLPSVRMGSGSNS